MKLNIGAGLTRDDYPRVAEKIKVLPQPLRWCDTTGECACMGCANMLMTWAEYECWRKYAPEFNRARLGDLAQ